MTERICHLVCTCNLCSALWTINLQHCSFKSTELQVFEGGCHVFLLLSLTTFLPSPFSFPSKTISLPKWQGLHIPSSLWLPSSGGRQSVNSLSIPPTKEAALCLDSRKYSTSIWHDFCPQNLRKVYCSLNRRSVFTCNYLKTPLKVSHVPGTLLGTWNTLYDWIIKWFIIIPTLWMRTLSQQGPATAQSLTG